MLKFLRFSLSQAFYEYRAKQWNMIIVALIFAVTMLASVQFIADKVRVGLEAQSASILGGDLVVESTVPISAEFQKQADQLHLKSAKTIVLQTMISHAGKFMLVNLQAVSPSYPLFGNAINIPAMHALINQRIATDYSLVLPETVKIGAAHFVVDSLIPGNVELSYSGWLIAPRVMINLSDLPATSTLIPGSRATYRLMLAGSQENLVKFYNDVKPLLTPQQKILTPKQQSVRLLDDLNIIIQFIQLAVIIGVILCGIAITLSVKQYVKRHYQQIALWRSLGATSFQIRSHYLLQLFLAAVLSMIVGVLLGYLMQIVILAYITPYANFIAQTNSIKPFIVSGAASFLILFCYAYPYISTLATVSSLEIWRDTLSQKSVNLSLGLVSFIAFMIFVLYLVDFSLFAMFVLDCLVLSVGLFMLAYIILLSILKRQLNYLTGVWYRGVKQIIQYPQANTMQMSALTLVITSLLILHFFKDDLLDRWRGTIAVNAPNYFAFNISSEETQSIKQYFYQYKLPAPIFYPMIKGRLIALNGQKILSLPEIDKSHNALHRDLNLSASEDYPSDNQIIKGQSWGVADRSKLLVSVESTLADALNLKIGDQLTFKIYDTEVSANVSNLRKVNWQSMHPNFYVIFTPDSLPALPVTYITSFYLSPENVSLVSKVLNEYPNVTIIDIAELLKQLQSWMTRASSAMQYIFTVSLIAAMLVLIASILTTIDERKETYVLIKILGGGKDYIAKSIVIEMMIVVIFVLLISYLTASTLFYFMLKII